MKCVMNSCSVPCNPVQKPCNRAFLHLAFKGLFGLSLRGGVLQYSLSFVLVNVVVNITSSSRLQVCYRFQKAVLKLCSTSIMLIVRHSICQHFLHSFGEIFMLMQFCLLHSCICSVIKFSSSELLLHNVLICTVYTTLSN